MERLWGYYRNFQSLRGDVGGLPSWARLVLTVAAVPGIVLIALSILALGVSILALLLLTVPLYGLLKSIAGGTAARADRSAEVFSADVVAGDFGRPGRKRVDATVVEPSEHPAP